MAQRKKDLDTDARQKLELIIKVLSKQKTASEAAKELGMSRKTYYKWENRLLEAAMEALRDRPSGRPSQPVDGEKVSLKKSMEQMRKQLLLAEQRAEIHTFFQEDLELIEALRKKGHKKKRGQNYDRRKHDQTERS